MCLSYNARWKIPWCAYVGLHNFKEAPRPQTQKKMVYGIL